MARPTSPLPPTGVLAAFAADLRDLRARAGDPSLVTMAQKGACSPAALSVAMSGKKLPSEEVLRSFLMGCECDTGQVDHWVARRSELAQIGQEELTRPVEARDTSGDCCPTVGQKHGRHRVHLTSIVLASALTLMLGGGIGFTVGRASTSDRAISPDTPTARPVSGVDPVSAGCTRDATLAASVEQPDGTLVQMMWSESCSANWGRITRNDNLVEGNRVTVVVTGHFTNAPDPQVATGEGYQTVYTPIIVVHPTDKVCVTGSRTVGEETIDVVEPVCA